MQLPKGWVWKKLGEVCKTTSGGTPSRTNTNYYNGSIPWVKSGELKNGIIRNTEEHISEEAVKNSSAKLFPAGTLLIALYGATVGRLAFLGIEATTNQAICGITPGEALNKDYLYWLLFFKRPQLLDERAGGAQPNISQNILRELILPLPPILAQKAIVAKIEELFSELDTGLQELQIALKRLRIYRQAVLHHYLNNPEWERVKLGDVSSVYVGATPSRKVADYWGGDVNWVSSGEVAFHDIKITREKITELGLSKTSTTVHPIGTVLLAMIGEGKTRGQAAILQIDAAHNQNTAAIRPNKDMLTTKFLYNHLMRSYNDNRRIGSGNNQQALNKSRVQEMIISLPDINTQAQIVLEIEAKLSEIDAMEATIRQELARAESLRQSILKRAFAGKLVVNASIEVALEEDSVNKYKASGKALNGHSEQLSLF